MFGKIKTKLLLIPTKDTPNMGWVDSLIAQSHYYISNDIKKKNANHFPERDDIACIWVC